LKRKVRCSRQPGVQSEMDLNPPPNLRAVGTLQKQIGNYFVVDMRHKEQRIMWEYLRGKMDRYVHIA
jgi:hypothetical protein